MSTLNPDAVQTVAVAGLGALGLRVARALDAGIPGLRLVAVSASTIARAREKTAGFASPPDAMALPALALEADIIVECLPPEPFLELAGAVARRAGAVFVPASVGALLLNPDIVATAAQHGCTIRLPSGAVCGLDGLSAAREAGLEQVRLVTRKAPVGLGLGDDVISTPELLFAGSAREAVGRFPRNMNVAAAIALAGAGPDRTEVELWSDPSIAHNRHELTIRSRAGVLQTTAENLPDPDNPGSSMLAAFSIVAILRALSKSPQPASF